MLDGLSCTADTLQRAPHVLLNSEGAQVWTSTALSSAWTPLQRAESGLSSKPSFNGGFLPILALSITRNINITTPLNLPMA